MPQFPVTFCGCPVTVVEPSLGGRHGRSQVGLFFVLQFARENLRFRQRAVERDLFDTSLNLTVNTKLRRINLAT